MHTGLHGWTASPAALGQTDTGQAQTHTQKGLREHSASKRKVFQEFDTHMVNCSYTQNNNLV